MADPTLRREPVRASYHHGDLRAALIAATDAILAEDGVEGFTLREAARRAGVSPAAPSHHFGSASGLLTEVATLGYRDLARYIAAVADDGETPREKLRVQAAAYVRFALAFPGRFLLMFRKDLVNRSAPGYVAATGEAFGGLMQTARAVYGVAHLPPTDPEALAAMFAAWSTMHGIAHLAIERKFPWPGGAQDADGFATEILPRILGAQWPD